MSARSSSNAHREELIHASVTEHKNASPKQIRLNAEEVARRVGGTLHGNPAHEVTGVRPLESADKEHLSFFSPTSKRNSSRLLEIARTSKVGILLVAEFDPSIQTTQIVCKQPLQAVMTIAPLLHPAPKLEPGVHPLASVAPTATLGESVQVGPYAVIGEGVTIGDRTTVHPHVVIYPHATIGSDCILHSGAVVREWVRIGTDCVIQNGAVIGGDGFGYFPAPGVGHHRIPHVGTVVLEDHVDIGANATVDRATLGESILRESTKVDNLVMIGHNADIGRRTLLCGQVGLSGSVKLGEDVVLGGQVGVADHAVVGARVKAAAKSGIHGTVPEGQIVAGYPAQEALVWRRREALLAKLPEVVRRLTGDRRRGTT